MTAFADACHDLARALPRAQALTATPDTDGHTRRTAPASRPPWNQAAATALLDAAEGARQLEAAWRSHAAGRPVPVRPMAMTGTVLASLLRLAHGLPPCPPAEYDEKGRPLPCRCERCNGTADLRRWALVIWQLPAVDEIERPWQPPVPCPRPQCARRMLRYYRRDKILACLGCVLKAAVTEGQLSGTAMLVWEDGLVQVAPVLVAP